MTAERDGTVGRTGQDRSPFTGAHSKRWSEGGLARVATMDAAFG